MIEYRTIRTAASHEIVIKKSRFICNISQAFTKEEAEDFICKISKQHYKATHNCVAYQIGNHNEEQKAIDNGEPSGTAGIPMLEVLKQNDLKNVVCVVTRYFGGVKLGTGGLVRAYSHSVSEAVKSIGIIERCLRIPLSLQVDYTLSGKVDYWIANSSYSLTNTNYLEKVTYTLDIPPKELDQVKLDLTNLTNAHVTFTIGQEHYVDLAVSI